MQRQDGDIKHTPTETFKDYYLDRRCQGAFFAQGSGSLRSTLGLFLHLWLAVANYIYSSLPKKALISSSVFPELMIISNSSFFFSSSAFSSRALSSSSAFASLSLNYSTSACFAASFSAAEITRLVLAIVILLL